MQSSTSLPDINSQWPELPFTVKATYSWSGEQKLDLGFLEGDIIEVSKIKGMWFYGRLLRNKKTGSFPANYVELFKKPEPITSESINKRVLYTPQRSQQHNSQTRSRESRIDRVTPASSRSRINIASTPSPTKLQTSSRSSNNNNYINASGGSSRFSMHSPVSTNTSVSPFGSPLNSKSKITHSQRSHFKSSTSPMSSANSPSSTRIFPASKSSPNIHRYTQLADDQRLNGLLSNSGRRSLERQFQNNKLQQDSLSDSKTKKLPSIPSHYDEDEQRFESRQYDLNSSASSSFDKSIVSFTQTKYWESSQDKNARNYIDSESTWNNNTLESNPNHMFEEDDPYDGSLAVMSNFSATSAGSFARHKFAKSFTDSKTKQDLPRLITSFNGNALNFNNSLTSLLQDSPMTPQPLGSANTSSNWLMKKIKSSTSNGSSSNTSSPINPKNFPELPDLSQLSLNGIGDEVDGWAMVNKQLNRANTLSGKEKYERRKRFLDEAAEDTDIVLEPHTVMIQSINSNEVTYDSHNGKPLTNPGMINMMLQDLDIEYLDMKTHKRVVKNGVQNVDSFAVSHFGSMFKTTLERLRAIFIFCTETYQLIDDNGSTNFKKPPMNLNEIMHRNYCTPYELTWIFKKLANSVGVHCEIVIGFLKTPNTNNLDFQLNHCWLTLIVNNEWRFVDVILGNISNPIHSYINGKQAEKAEDFYFLTEPLKLIYSHIPYRTKDQHIVPEIDNVLPMCLPTTFPNFFKNELKFHRFDNSLRYLNDTEVFEMSLFIANDIEVFASVVIDDKDMKKKKHYEGADLCLVQVKWYKQKRIAFIKAVLPPGTKQGTLHIHSGPKGMQSTFVNIHPLSIIVPLKHSGSDKNIEYEFVRVLPAVTAADVDMYIKKPENKYVYLNYEYNFQSIMQPSDGLVASKSYGFTSSKKKMVALQSPSGKVYKYKKNDAQSEYGTWELKLKLGEVGIWTGLVTNDSGAGFAAYAEWTCI
ncbi:Cytokinesis protein 3 [Hanseniaspora osmophila]|uniref:Cytokinesis protein 3 n=1 Tax=Hanseniaspora osmophila TaxID=56408 RepID=A0A1E5RN65_9ASCO|nr:Cytokinesis protein 3 [Hanseniaspora osmophila]